MTRMAGVRMGVELTLAAGLKTPQWRRLRDSELDSESAAKRTRINTVTGMSRCECQIYTEYTPAPSESLGYRGGAYCEQVPDDYV